MRGRCGGRRRPGGRSQDQGSHRRHRPSRPLLTQRGDRLIEGICRNGHEAIGKPEPLRQRLSGYRFAPDHRRTASRLPGRQRNGHCVFACRFRYR
nr:type II toxin-antitoxin system YoeB family toxin [Nocardia carnea]